MTLQDFSMQYQMNPTRTNRSVRVRALQGMIEMHGLNSSRLDDLDVRPYEFDADLGIGVHATTTRGSSRFSYQVTQPERLARWLKNKHGADLLSRQDITRLLDFAVFLRQVARGKERMWDIDSYRTEVSRDSRQKVDELERILRKAGRVE